MRDVAADSRHRERSILRVKARYDQAIAAEGRLDVVLDKHMASQV